MKSVFLLFFIIFFLTKTSFSMDIFTFPKERIIVDGRSFKVLVASTVKQREQGLSNVKLQTLKANGIDGMLFVFNEGNERTFQAWYMNFDLLLLGLEKTGPNQFKIVSRKLLNIGTTANIGGRYVLELPLTNNTLLGR